MSKSRSPNSESRSLKQILTDLFRRKPRSSPAAAPSVGSGILRKSDTPAPLLPVLSVVSLFPDFESNSVESLCYKEVPETTCPTLRGPSRHSLLPKTSLSQFDLRRSYVEHAREPLRVVYESIPESLAYGISRRGSLVSVQSSDLYRSTSSLRLRRSTQTLTPRTSISGLRRSQSSLRSQSSWRSKSASAPLNPSTPHQPRRHDLSPRGCLATNNEASQPAWRDSVKLFGSFSVLDTATAGYPVTATSEDLKYIFDIGEQFFLNNQECTDVSMDVVTGCDAMGNPITHLVLFSPLVSPSSGRSRFMLASLIDITGFIQDTPPTTELATISEESLAEVEVQTPMHSKPNARWRTPQYGLSAEDLLGGCFMQEDTGARKTPPMPVKRPLEDIWLNIASEAKVKSRSRSTSGSRAPKSHSCRTASTTGHVDDGILDEFIAELQEVYSDFFLLAKSPLDDSFYEICNVSPTAHASKDYVHGHLSHTSPQEIAHLSELLGWDRAFHMVVRWGIKGEEKQLYCVPMFGQSSITWICFLVDMHVGALW